MEPKLIKNEKEIEIMRGLGKILSSIFDELKKYINPGTDVWNLENKFLDLCEQSNVKPSCKGYQENGLPPFPTGLCVSINEESVHCFPKKGRILSEGDIINIDTVIDYAGLYVDSAFCKGVGVISEKNSNLINTTEKALYEAISKVKDGAKIGLIANTLQKVVLKGGFNVLKDYAGHGIGYTMHEYPEIPCYGNKHEGPKIKGGMTICIESLVCGNSDIVENVSEWETKTADDENFCIFEHTVLVKKDGFEVLTK